MRDRLKPGRQQLVARVGLELGRELSAQTVFFHELVARRLGLNATDTRCLDLVSRAPGSSMSAGELGRATGLTTGAITGVLDRLEAAGLVQRFRDSGDRRKVMVLPAPGAAARLSSQYHSLSEAMVKLASSYKTSELELIHDFLERNLELMRAQVQSQSE